MTEQDRPDTSDDDRNPSEEKTAAEAPGPAKPAAEPAAEAPASEKPAAEPAAEEVEKPAESPAAEKATEPAESPAAEPVPGQPAAPATPASATSDAVATEATAVEPAPAPADASPADASPGDASPAAPAPASAKKKRPAVLLGVGAGVLALVALALAAFVWPGFLAGPGAPDEIAAQATTALGSKNSAGLDSVSCRGDDGKVIAQLPQEAFQLVQSAKVAGPPTLLIDTQAQQPIDLVLTVQGQTQNVPANVILGVNDGDWCVLGLSMR
ncbi:MAG: hypothetical protein ACT4O0_17490 [Pseudonocardia sp.]